jgi:hypothetical protein
MEALFLLWQRCLFCGGIALWAVPLMATLLFIWCHCFSVGDVPHLVVALLFWWQR